MLQGLCCRFHGPAAASRFFASRKLCQIQLSSLFSQHQPYRPYRRSSLSRRAVLQPNRVQRYDTMIANSSPRFQMEDPAFALSKNVVSSTPGTPRVCALQHPNASRLKSMPVSSLNCCKLDDGISRQGGSSSGYCGRQSLHRKERPRPQHLPSFYPTANRTHVHWNTDPVHI